MGESWPLGDSQNAHVGDFLEEKAFPGLAGQSAGKGDCGRECPVPCQAWGGRDLLGRDGGPWVYTLVWSL